MLRAVCDQLALVLERDRLLRDRDRRRDPQADRDGAAQRCSRRSRTTSGALWPRSRRRSPICSIPRWSARRRIARRVLHVVDQRDRPARRARREPPGHVADRGRRAAGAPRDVDLAETVTGRGRRRGAALARRAHRAWRSTTAHEVAVADPVFLPRVVSNLLDNAARSAVAAGSPSVEIEIGPTDHGQRRAQVAVRSSTTGPGSPRGSAPSCSCPSPGSTSGRRNSAPASGSRSRRGSSI